MSKNVLNTEHFCIFTIFLVKYSYVLYVKVCLENCGSFDSKFDGSQKWLEYFWWNVGSKKKCKSMKIVIIILILSFNYRTKAVTILIKSLFFEENWKNYISVWEIEIFQFSFPEIFSFYITPTQKEVWRCLNSMKIERNLFRNFLHQISIPTSPCSTH